jgi:hypothetical protein
MRSIKQDLSLIERHNVLAFRRDYAAKMFEIKPTSGCVLDQVPDYGSSPGRRPLPWEAASHPYASMTVTRYNVSVGMIMKSVRR